MCKLKKIWREHWGKKDDCEGSLINIIKRLWQGKSVDCQTGCQEKQLKFYSIDNKEIL